MPVNKDHQEFHAVDFDDGFETIPGYPEGFKHKILTGFLDEDDKQGGRTRLLKIEPGTFAVILDPHGANFAVLEFASG